MVDDSYCDVELAELYDPRNPWGPSDEFYLGLVMSARAVLDVGCGTGALLDRARKAGHCSGVCRSTASRNIAFAGLGSAFMVRVFPFSRIRARTARKMSQKNRISGGIRPGAEPGV